MCPAKRKSLAPEDLGLVKGDDRKLSSIRKEYCMCLSHLKAGSKDRKPGIFIDALPKPLTVLC